MALSVRLEDLSAAARIRHAALENFATRGYEGTSIRTVAAAAGVSAGSVQHHYRSKEALREAVDEYVVTTLRRALEEIPAHGQPGQVAEQSSEQIAEFLRRHPAVFAYVRRTIAEGHQLGQQLLDGLVALGRAQFERLERAGTLRDDVDLEWVALQNVLLNVSVMFFQPAIERHLGQSVTTEPGLTRLRDAMTQLFAHGVFADPSSTRQSNRNEAT